jgi:TolB-like protein/Flp pilus assembly protein TadD/predicted Ser/Thr protein kinase
VITQSITHYRIIKKLGAGGMGEVYLGEDTRLDRNVAIKFLPPESTADEQARKRLIREAKAAAKLDHPNICSIYEVGEEAGQSFIVMQYVEGETLDMRIQRKPLELRESLDIAVQVVDALSEAHSSGIVHRDIKPPNIMVNARGNAKVMDFGLAKIIEHSSQMESKAETQSLLTEPGMIIGTVPYMSPEQVRGEALDARSDIFSFGAVLYEMISGRQPFAAESAAATASAILTKEPWPVARFAPEAPAELQRILRKCLEKDRERRYQTVRDLATDLENVRNARHAPQQISQDASAAEGNRYAGTSLAGISLSWRTVTLSGSILILIAAALVYAVWFRVAPAAGNLDIKSLAVLPLRSLSTDVNDDYLGLGITDTIITKISQIGELTVRPTSAVRKYLHEEMNSLEAARQLQTDAVLDGSIQRAGDHLRVNVNLLRVRDGASLWAESFVMKQSDIFAIQDRISKEIVTRLKPRLSPTEAARLDKRYTTNPEAYEYHLKGRANLERITTAIGDRQAIDAAISYFKKAVELDPKYALAYAVLGYTYMWMANFNDPDSPVWVGLAQEALSKAEALDPQLAEIHDARFEYYFSKYGNWDLAQAAREGRQALALNPSVGHLAVGTFYDHVGLDEALGLQEFQRALEIDPTNTFVQNRLIESYQLYGKFDEAIEAHRHFFGTHGPEFALIAKGRLDEAQPLLEDAINKNSGDLRARSRLALLIALRGKFQEAEAAIPPILKQARNNRAYHHITYDIACVYALEGKTDEAVKWLRTTAETGMPNYPLFARDPHLDRIRRESAFVRFMADLKPRWESYKREFE